MPIIQANVPQAHLATAIGAPNRLLVEYSTDILLPVPGPYLIARLRRDFIRGLMELNEFLAFTEDARPFFSAGETLNFVPAAGHFVMKGRDETTAYNRRMSHAALNALDRERRAASRIEREHIPVNTRRDRTPTRESLLERLSTPNFVFREMFDAGVLRRSPTVFSQGFAGQKTFNGRCATVLRRLLQNRKAHAPQNVTNTMTELVDQALEEARTKYPGFLHTEFTTLSAQTRQMLIRWLAAFHLDKIPRVPNPFAVDLTPIIGFQPVFFVREWALNRRERLELVFGTPDLRGPVGAEPVAPQGTYRREDYTASQDEITLITAERRHAVSQESLTLSVGTLRRALNSVHYSGAGALNQLTDQAANALLTEERRSVVQSIVRQVSETQENARVDVGARSTSSTIVREAPGVDLRLAATHHRFKVVVPIDATVEMYDVGLTWSPRVFNPFFALRRAIRSAYTDARDSHLSQYYVPEPVTPPLTFERYNVGTELYMESDDPHHRVSKGFTIQLAITDREDRPDFVNAVAEFTQDRGFWRNDSDDWTVDFEITSYSGGTIRGRVFVEMEDEDKWYGYVNITIPVLRYSQDTVNALAQFEIEMRDYNLKRQALEAQAHQYARIKQREFIERHERLDDLQKIVFEALIRRVCLSTLSQEVSYYKEIIARCIDWSRAKMEFESSPMNALAYTDFPPDHFVNSPAVRFFLPIIHTAEVTLFDTLAACGSFQVRARANAARARVDAIRNRLQAGGPEQLDQFSTEMVIGEHVEAVMSEHDHAS